MVSTVAVFNQKGGVGKTTTSVNLATMWARNGHKTLLVDMDSQGNATSAVGIDPPPPNGVFEALIDGMPMHDVIVPTKIDHLELAPASQNLAALDINLIDRPRPQFFLRDSLRGLGNRFEFVVIDCPPTFSLPSINALVAADEVVMPSHCYRFAQTSLHATWSNVRQLAQSLNPGLEINGILLIGPEATTIASETAHVIRAEFGFRVYDTMIPADSAVVEAEETDTPLVLVNPDCPAALAYAELLGEIERRLTNETQSSEGDPFFDAAVGHGWTDVIGD